MLGGMSQERQKSRPDVHGGNVYVGPPLGRSLVKALLAVATARPAVDRAPEGR